MNDIVMVQLFGGQHLAETQPELMQFVDLVGGEVGGVRAEDLEDFIAGGGVNFQVELGLGVMEFFPGFADLPGLLLGGPFDGSAENDGGGLEALRGAQEAFP